MQPLQMDWAFVHAALEQLEPYLLSKTLFWQLPALAEGEMTTLTPGNLILSLKKLRGYPWQPEEKAKVNQFTFRLLEIKRQWGFAFQQKAALELPKRLQLWENYLVEVIKERKPHANFAFSVRWRVLIDLLLMPGIALTPSQSRKLIEMDQFLLAVTYPGMFIWEQEIAPMFPKNPFWYLYRSHKKTEKGG